MGLNFLAGGTIFTSVLIKSWNGPLITLLFLVFTGALYLAAYRFINKALFGEKIFINKSMLLITRNKLFGNETILFDISKISNLRFVDKPTLSNHPLQGKSIDYLGFQTEQKVINEMHGDKRIAFDYGGSTVAFGEDLASWEFEEMTGLIRSYNKDASRLQVTQE